MTSIVGASIESVHSKGRWVSWVGWVVMKQRARAYSVDGCIPPS